MLNKKYHSVETVSRYNRKIAKKGNIDTPNTQWKYNEVKTGRIN